MSWHYQSDNLCNTLLRYVPGSSFPTAQTIHQAVTGTGHRPL